MSFKGFLQTTWCLSLVQYPPHARYRGASGRCGHPARAGAAMGAFAAAMGALDPRPRCAARESCAGGGPCQRSSRTTGGARAMGEEAGRCGAVTFIQRFGGALNLNVHFHCVVPDGVFVREGGALHFVAVRPPTDEEVQTVLLRVARWLDRLLRPHRPGPDTELS